MADGDPLAGPASFWPANLGRCCVSFQTVKEMLENPSEPVSDLSYFDCIEGVMEKSKVALPSSARVAPLHSAAGSRAVGKRRETRGRETPLSPEVGQGGVALFRRGLGGLL